MPPIGFSQVDAIITRACGKAGLEPGGNFGADLIAAGADTGAHGGLEMASIAPVGGQEALDGGGGYLGRRAAPSGVNCRNGARLGIEQQDGHAIGRSNADRAAWLGGDESITGGLAIFERIGGDHVRGMDLAKSDVGSRIGMAGAKSMSLPNELIPCLAAVNPITFSEMQAAT